MPIDYKKYPQNWKTVIRPEILHRAQNCCENCGVKNYAIGYRNEFDNWIDIEKSFAGDMIAEDAKEQGYKVIKIVLTIAHLDNDITHNDYNNLKALCQRCHNRMDINFRVANRYKNKHKNNLKMEL